MSRFGCVTPSGDTAHRSADTPAPPSLRPPGCWRGGGEAAALTLCPPAARSHLGSWLLRREEGGGKPGSFPQCTSADCMKMESGAGEDDSAPIRRGGLGLCGGGHRMPRGDQQGQLHLHIPCYLGLSRGSVTWGCPCSAEPPPLLPQTLPGFAAITLNITIKLGGNILGRGVNLIKWDNCV